MARAMALAADGWIALPPGIGLDYRGPTGLSFEPFGEAGRDRPALASLAAQVARRPGSVAYDDPAGPLDFAALWQCIGRLAPLLRGEGPVGLLLPMRRDDAIGIFACLAAGRAALLLDAAQSPARHAALLARAGATLVLGPAASCPTAQAAGLPFVALEEARGAGAFVEPDGGAMDQDAPAFILATSGSTGEPKLLAYSQRGLLQQTRMVVDSLHVSAADRVLTLNPHTTIGGLLSLFLPLAGAPLDIVSLAGSGLREVRERFRTHPPTVLRAGAALIRVIAMMPDARGALASLRAVRLGGDQLTRADLATLEGLVPPGCVIQNRYGSTEMMGTWWPARLEETHDPVRVASGLPDPDVEIRLVDEAGNTCPPGEPGELWLRSRYGALGEIGLGGLHPGRLEPDVADPTRRIYRSGDIARLTEDGLLVVIGRRDRMVKINGQRVELAEVEAVIRRDPAVREAAVLAAETAGRTALRAFVVPGPGQAEGLEQRLRAGLRAALPPFMQPARIELLEALPRLAGGKLDAQSLLSRR